MAQTPKNSNSSQQIDENLRRVYQEVVEQDVPDRFKDLLARLKQQDTPSQESSK